MYEEEPWHGVCHLYECEIVVLNRKWLYDVRANVCECIGACVRMSCMSITIKNRYVSLTDNYL